MGDVDDFGDDFDEFEEGAQAGADDDFDDFDDDFQQPHLQAPQPEPSPSLPRHVHPLIDFDGLSDLPDLLAATEQHLDALFPYTTAESLNALPKPSPIDNTSPIFPSDRSRSLWKQLVTPPPLQPPNWTQSRIRRLFLVSLGVPVDLDEILPPSKQKKLVLPDINLEPSSRKSESDKTLGSVARLKAQLANDSTGSVDSTQSGTTKERRSKRPKGSPPPPELDLMAVKRLCATTDEKLDGFTEEELRTVGVLAQTERWAAEREGGVRGRYRKSRQA